MARDEGIQGAIDAFEATLETFVAGDAGPTTAQWSRRDDITIFGGWGAYERGWAAVSSRLAWAASRFSGGRVTYEPLAAGSSGDLGYAIGLERGEAHVAGQGQPSPLVLRVTHLFRREEGEWRMIHPHADPITVKTAPMEILQR